jgi:hypothetical protein
MSRMPIRRLVITCCCLPFVSAVACASYSNFYISVKRETWTGLGGVVLREGERVKLPDLLWEVKSAAKPEGDDVFPTPIVPSNYRRLEVKEPLAKFEVADPVVLRIRGKKIKFEAVGTKSTTIPSDYDGLYLAYSLKETELQLTLSKSPGKETAWKVVDAQRGMSKSGGEFQFNITQRVKFRLEAANRPGWFLYADNERGMCLSAEEQERRLIELEIGKRYDDHSDGK